MRVHAAEQVTRARPGRIGLPHALIVLASALALLPAALTSAQDQFNCDDFASQFDAQTELNRTFPEDPNRLDADNDWIACEDHFGLTPEEEAAVVPADAVNRAADAGDDEPLDGPIPQETPMPAPPSPSTPPVSTRVDAPAEMLARVEGCAVIAISSRSVAAAGCPGVGAIVLRIPDGAPRMKSRVILDPGAPFATGARPGANVNASSPVTVETAQKAKPRTKDRVRRRSSERAHDGTANDRQSEREPQFKRNDRRR